MRDDFLAAELEAYLNRKAVPTSLHNKPQAQAAEIAALLGALNRYAPKGSKAEFWGRVERYLDERSTSRAWPTVGELVGACKECRPSEKGETEHRLGDAAVDTYAVHARRISEGEAVGDEWLYGRLALELVERGLATEARLNQYRSGLYFKMKETWGEEKARWKEDEYKARHEAAKQTQRYVGPPPAITFKRMGEA